jgi:hypothetical protein
MQTRIYESDPFTAKPQDLLVSFESAYRFEKGDELYIDRPQRPLKVRIIDVRVHIADGGLLSRDILALKL